MTSAEYNFSTKSLAFGDEKRNRKNNKIGRTFFRANGKRRSENRRTSRREWV